MSWNPPIRQDGSLRPIEGADQTLLVTSYAALIQAAGYPKYIMGSTHYVAYRGQTTDHGALVPSLFRGVKLGAARKRMGRLRHQVEAYHRRRDPLSGTPGWALPPLLQHYGIRTQWLDLVDNYWVALWFALHDLVATGTGGRFVSIRRRDIRPQEPTIVGTEAFEDAIGFVQVIGLPLLDRHATQPGLLTNDSHELVDLRVAAPSLYIRPHAQHGLLVRRSRIVTEKDLSLDELVVCTLVVRVAEAREWIGGLSLEHRSIFPSPHDDPGYHKLLNSPLTDPVLGGVTWVGY